MSGLPAHDGHRPLFFVHIMKTAGTSLFWALCEAVGVEHIVPRPAEPGAYVDTDGLLARGAGDFAGARLIMGHFPFYCAARLPLPVEVTTVLRDPVERTLSLLRQHREHHFDPSTPLESVYDDPGVFTALVQNHQVKQFALCADDGTPNYLAPLPVDRGRFEEACRNLASVPLFGLTENLEAYFRALCARFEWTVELPSLRVSSDKTPVDPALRRRIAADNAWDLAFYDFARELLATRA